MGKIPSSSPHLNPNPYSCKTKPKKKHFQTINNLTRHADESPAVTQTTSDDAYSYNQRPIESNSFNIVDYKIFKVSSLLKFEMKDFKRLLVSELDRIRSLNNRIESGQIHSRSNQKVKKMSGNKRPLPMGSIKDQNHDNNNGNFSNGNEIGHENTMKMCRQILTKLMKHKQSWIYNTPVDAAALGLHDYHQIIKRPMDLGSIKSNMAKNLYSSPAGFASDVRLVFNNAMLYNPKTDAVHIMAKELLDWFEDMFRPISQKIQHITSSRRDNRHNFGVDDDELQGSSCNDIRQKEPKIKKSKPSPNIAPLSRQSNKLQVPPQQPNVISSVRTPLPVPAQQPNVMSPVRTPSPVPAQQPIVMSPVRMPSPVPAQQPIVMSPVRMTSPVPAQHPNVISPVRTPSPLPARQQQQEQVKSIGKLPKPKAKDPNKREMSEEEKHKLGYGLQNLPQEKMPQLVQIIKKKNDHLDQDGDEIELDIEALDTETLWELDRFVTNWKKFASKTKREALMGNYPSAPTPTPDQIPLSDPMDDITKTPKKDDGEEDDVDIGDEIEIPENNFQPLEMDEDANDVQLPEPTQGQNHNNPSISSGSSSSSGSDSSSSDSGSSSGSDSVADEAQS